MHTLLRKDLHKCLHMKATLTYKGKAAGGIKICAEHIEYLKKMCISKPLTLEDAFQYPITSVPFFNYINLDVQL